MLNEKRLGTLYIQSDLFAIYERAKLYGVAVAMILLGSFSVAVAFSRILQQQISVPILSLAETARLVTQRTDYGLRAKLHSQDELGVLTSSFNHMLEQIQQRDLALRDSEERLNLALRSSGVGTWNWDIPRDRFTWDDHTFPLFGIKPGAFQGTYQAFLDTIFHEDRSRLETEISKCLQDQTEYETEFRVVWPDSSIHVLTLRAKVYSNAQRQPSRMAGVCLDITEKKKGENRLKAFAMQLQRSNRELEDFARVASHDLQEPLRKVQAFGDRLTAKCHDTLGEQGRDYLARMQHAAERMAILIQDLLAFSRVTTKARPFDDVDLNEVTHQVLSDLEARVEQTGAQIEVSHLPKLQSDPTQMRQLMQNLIGNAIKFAKKGEPPRIKVSGHANGSDVCQIMVQDHGIGFDEKYLDRIFTVFQRLHGRNEYEGTGIGLAVCRKIVDRHGGRITAKSAPGEGATFMVTLPLRQPEAEQAYDSSIS
jgi:PAS domain S-box-containing protein